MKRWALRVAYDGASWPGWQTQPGATAIQDRLEAALTQIAAEPVVTVCAGRTDAGVHAVSQVVHFETSVERPESAWTRGANAVLPASIAVQRACEVDTAFHARYSAQRRAYRYVLLRAVRRHPLLHARVGWIFQPIDVGKMQEAARLLEGEQDFSAFRSSQCQARGPVRRLDSITVREDGALVTLDFVANAFLHHMVRNMVGALVWVGMGRRPVAWVAELLAARDRRMGAPTHDGAGLYLTGVDYADAANPLDCWPPAPVPLAAP